MAHLLRVTLAALLWAVALSATALVPKATGFRGSDAPTSIPLQPTADQAMGLYVTWKNNVFNPTSTNIIVSTGACSVIDASAWKCPVQDKNRSTGALGGTGNAVMTTYAAGVCPANSTASGASCACSAPYTEDPTHTFCVAPKSELQVFCEGHAAAKNAFSQSGSIGSTSPLPLASCYKPDPPFTGADAVKGCAMKLGDGIAVPRADNPLLRDWSATGIPTGATCEDAVATDAAPKAVPNPCPDGFPGTLNGSTVCVKREADKGIDGVKGTEQLNADGTSTTTKETTKCEGGQCTTTKETTTKDSTGAQVGAVKTEQTKEGIGAKCAKDPGNKVCAAVGMGEGEGGASFSGDCAAGFQVKGEDPILNAMALEQYKRNCELLNKTNTDSAWVLAERDRTTDRTADNPNNSTVSVGPADIDTSDALGGGAHCIADKVVQVAGSSVLLPFSKVCGSLELLGNVLLGVSLLAAAGIVLRG